MAHSRAPASNAPKRHFTNKNVVQKHDADPIVAKLQRAIEESGMTPVQIAAKAQTSYQTVQKIADAETRLPRHGTVARIFEACGVRQRYTKNGKSWGDQ